MQEQSSFALTPSPNLSPKGERNLMGGPAPHPEETLLPKPDVIPNGIKRQVQITRTYRKPL
jgi:hypothetical protein